MALPSRKIAQTGTVKLRIYKVFTRVDQSDRKRNFPLWKEVNVLEKLDFEVEDSQDEQMLEEKEEIKSDLLIVDKKKQSSGMDIKPKQAASGEKHSQSQKLEKESPLSQLEMLHIELTGVCTDDDRNDFTTMMNKFATKFRGLVELAPVTSKKIDLKV